MHVWHFSWICPLHATSLYWSWQQKLQADSLKAAIIVLTVLIVSLWDSSKSSLPFDLAYYSTNTPL